MRVFNTRVGPLTKQVEEFSIGDRVSYDDKCTGRKGEATILAFAQDGYHPTIWFKDEKGDIKTIHLAWCTKL